MPKSQRVMVFIDYQNVRNDFRHALAPSSHHATGGQFSPAKLAALLVAKIPGPTALAGVRLDTGMPDPYRESDHAAVAAAQAKSWRRSKVALFVRPLLYPADWPVSPAVQKGVDVEMAIDIAVLAVRDYDIGVTVTTDTDFCPRSSALPSSRRARRPQAIHGDLTGNVLFADPLPPAVIDLAVYWRPAAYARAIVVADALAWEGATPDDLAAATSGEGFGQFLARALLFRMVTDWLANTEGAPTGSPAYASGVDLAVRLIEE